MITRVLPVHNVVFWKFSTFCDRPLHDFNHINHSWTQFSLNDFALRFCRKENHLGKIVNTTYDGIFDEFVCICDLLSLTDPVLVVTGGGFQLITIII